MDSKLVDLNNLLDKKDKPRSSANVGTNSYNYGYPNTGVPNYSNM